MVEEKQISKKTVEKKSVNGGSHPKIAIVRVRGITGINTKIKDTLTMLNLHKKNYCVIVPATPSYIGMIKKVKDYVTYGYIDSETEKLLLEKKAEKSADGSLKPFFRLNPPKKGYGRKGIKVPFSLGGALGNRGDKINDLIQRMF